jgi:eukaryotic-like serine/threonine-protein kinase
MSDARIAMDGENGTGSAGITPQALPSIATRSVVGTAPEPGPAAHPVDMALGRKIGRYQVRRVLGHGGMGKVYLARDTVLGRSIALKVLAGHAPTDRFLDEARAIATLNHPNIVQLYDFGAFDGGHYLALEYIEGDTLRERIRSGRIELDDALRYSHAIASALAHAHAAELPPTHASEFAHADAAQLGARRGVLHCDLKPSNVMIGRDGRVRVVDFGIARTSDDAVGTGSGTADWMAPEQWRAAPLTDRVDIWALAIVCTQLATGRHPFGDDPASRRAIAREPGGSIEPDLSLDPLPTPVAGLVARSLVHDAALRPSAVEWTRVLDDVINDRVDTSSEEAPYPGLAAFEEQHARFFFGREREIDEVVERLRDTPCLPIVGPSGSGKSSFLHAGVIPRLRKRERWTVLGFRPGPDPVGALARCVNAATSSNHELDDLQHLARRTSSAKAELHAFREALLEHPRLLAVRLATLAATRNNRVLLAVDQLEEAFTQGASNLERARFLAMVLGAADDPLDPIRVVFTIRDDFFGKLAGLRSLLVMRKLDPADLRLTITEPLDRCRYEFDDSKMVDDLISEVGSAAVADLPLLQFACRTLWDGRDAATRRLRRATYVKMGGLAGALAKHAEDALTRMTPEERGLSRKVLLQLVSGSTRRSVALDELVVSVGPGADRVIDRLLAARLLVLRVEGDGNSEAALVEITHESLLQTWSQLARWVDETREERRLLDDLADATSRWERRGRTAEDTWSRDELATAHHRAAQLSLTIPASVQAFLAAGDQRHRALRRRRRIRIGMALAMVSAVALIAFTLIARYLAREQLIRANAGTVDFVFSPFDWVDHGPAPVDIAELPGFRWELYAAAPDDVNRPGAPIPTDEVDLLASSTSGGRRIDRVRAQGGLVFLKLIGRGRGATPCAAAWIRIQAFPGYRSGVAPRQLAIEFPTCQASENDMLPVEAGRFLYGGPGEPRSSFYGKPDYTQDERAAWTPAFLMDRTEVANSAFAPFARLQAITGYAAPVYSNDTTHLHDGDPDMPVTNIDAFRAEAFCRYMGKELPGDLEWAKAARGGEVVRGAPNRYPRRQYPWGTAPSPTCVNQFGTQDGAAWTTPVDSYACGAGPYGHLNLIGNVDEWIARDKQLDRDITPLYVIRGGSVDSPPELEHATISFRNHRDPNKMDYSIGFRCMSP